MYLFLPALYTIGQIWGRHDAVELIEGKGVGGGWGGRGELMVNMNLGGGGSSRGPDSPPHPLLKKVHINPPAKVVFYRQFLIYGTPCPRANVQTCTYTVRKFYQRADSQCLISK
jgi:hypothetical protein